MPQIPIEIETLLSAWNTDARILMGVGYLLIALGILSSLAVTTFADTLGTAKIKLLAFSAAVCTALLASFHPIETGNDYRDAWRVLNAAKLAYQLDEKERDPAKLVLAAKTGESIIARTPVPSHQINGTSASNDPNK